MRNLEIINKKAIRQPNALPYQPCPVALFSVETPGFHFHHVGDLSLPRLRPNACHTQPPHQQRASECESVRYAASDAARVQPVHVCDHDSNIRVSLTTTQLRREMQCVHHLLILVSEVSNLHATWRKRQNAVSMTTPAEWFPSYKSLPASQFGAYLARCAQLPPGLSAIQDSHMSMPY